MERYVCIHGHYYQPPRENPWTGAVERQPSAAPYHDWNERVTAECYAPNAAARILDGDGHVAKTVNLYARISFNVGPTLLSWMESHAPEVYRAILDADRESRRRYSGHGSAIAQVYNHMIMPLATWRDKRTQVIWGIRDFAHRVGRAPEGMWLPETGVDVETLEVLAEQGIRFTILSPHQAVRVREVGRAAWEDVGPAGIDPTMPYRIPLPSGRAIHAFFYLRPVARDVAFADLLTDGERFTQALLGAFDGARGRPQIAHIATDGETYGHHKKFGEMALAYALHAIESRGLARLTNYGEYLARYPATHDAQIAEFTAWSCAHGVERWRGDCGCRQGSPEWSQAWRDPLRLAMDWLRDRLVPRYAQEVGRYLADPWAARDDYIAVVLDPSARSVERFLRAHAARPAARPLEDDVRARVLTWLEVQRHTMLMYTSCGWFFDDIAGIEATQVLRYAGRAIQLAQELTGEALEPGFLQILARARSNLPERGNGVRVYETAVRAAMPRARA
ncbi:MAG: DUF3536 domain-containing protein [Armatimonadetes bacterium]|nr:DUF3536 domain-containing protein [Armatimonadota bacterium]